MRLIVAALACLWAISAQGASLLYVPGPAQVGPSPALMAGPPSGSGCTAATNYLARTTGGNEGGNAANITTLICGLVTDGVITGNLSGARGCGSILDGLYILAQQNATDAVLNLCGTSYPITPSTATFTLYQGYSAFPTDGVDAGFNPSTATSPNYVLNSASLGAWSYDAPSASSISVGTDVGTNASVVFTEFGGTSYAEVNASDPTVSVPTIGAGLNVSDRSGATAVNLYHNGSSVASGTPSATGVPTVDMNVGGAASGFGTSTTISEAHYGKSLGTAGNLALYTRLRTYMTAVGVP